MKFLRPMVFSMWSLAIIGAVVVTIGSGVVESEVFTSISIIKSEESNGPSLEPFWRSLFS
jgi:hypothetical protein